MAWIDPPLLKTVKWFTNHVVKAKILTTVYKALSFVISYSFASLPSTPATLTNLLFLKKSRHNPASGLLLFLSLSLECCSPKYLHCSLPHFLQVSVQMPLSQRELPIPPHFKLHYLHKHPALQHSQLLSLIFLYHTSFSKCHII